jgi:hypothetical protein
MTYIITLLNYPDVGSRSGKRIIRRKRDENPIWRNRGILRPKLKGTEGQPAPEGNAIYLSSRGEIVFQALHTIGGYPKSIL